MFDLEHIWQHMGPLSRGIAIFLALMAVASIGVFVERVLTLRRGRRESLAFAKSAREALATFDLQALAEIGARHRAAPLARLFRAVALRHQKSAELGSADRAEPRLRHELHDSHGSHLSHASHGSHERRLTPAQAARHEAERTREAIGADMRRGMSILASVGSVAPFVGLLGTVIGIISTFQALGQTGGGDNMKQAMNGIGEALAETALGLVVAIPAVLLFNYLTTRLAALELALARSVGELCDEMEERDGRKHDRRELARQAA